MIRRMPHKIYEFLINFVYVHTYVHTYIYLFYVDLHNLNESLRETKDVLEKQIGEKTSLIEEYLATMKGLEMKLKDMERECTSKEATESDLRRKLELTTEDLREKSISIDKMRQEFDENTSSLRLELNETRKTIEEINDRHAIEKRSLITEYEKIIEDKNGQIEMKSQQLATESQKRLESQSELLENLKADNMKRIGELSESFDQQLNVKEAKLKEMASRLNEKITEARKLEDELSNQKDLYARKDGELNDAFFKLEGRKTIKKKDSLIIATLRNVFCLGLKKKIYIYI